MTTKDPRPLGYDGGIESEATPTLGAGTARIRVSCRDCSFEADLYNYCQVDTVRERIEEIERIHTDADAADDHNVRTSAVIVFSGP